MVPADISGLRTVSAGAAVTAPPDAVWARPEHARRPLKTATAVIERKERRVRIITVALVEKR
jgi:hypothetical protein